MKKLSLALSAIALCAFSSAFAKDVTFHVIPTFSYLDQIQNEYLFKGTSRANDHKVSEINWEQNDLGLCGILASAETDKCTFTTVFATAIPANCGYVFDSDWKNISNTSVPQEIADYKTNYSESISYLNFFHMLNTQVNYNLIEDKNFKFIPFLGIDAVFFRNTARGLSAWYGDYTKDSTQGYWYYSKYDSGTEESLSYDDSQVIMELERFYLVSWIGIRIEMIYYNHLSIGLQAGISPFAFLNSIDSHILKNAYYNDRIFTMNNIIKYGMEFSFNFDRYLSFYLSASRTFSALIEGKTFSSNQKYSGYNQDYGYYAGASFRSKQITAGYRISF